MAEVFAELIDKPYWWEAVPRERPAPADLPETVDALVVGSGFSGLGAARVLARAGLSVIVCEAAEVGYGASTRNGGMLGPSFHKLGMQGLKAHYGEQQTDEILKESIGIVGFMQRLIDDEGIDCEYRQTGRFRGASRPSHYEAMARETERQVAVTGMQAEAIPASAVRDEIGTNRFFGGIRYAMDGGLHPAKYHDGLTRVVREAGGVIAGHTPVTAVEADGAGFRVATTGGVIRAGQVAICTNGYTGKATPWFRRRVLPIRSSIIATEELSADLMHRLMPTQRMYGDSRRIMAYYRPSPDGRRILFGGRGSARDDALVNARKLRASMIDVFPELKNTRITHSWSGLVAYAFDHVPHLGRHDGLWYAMGYCGSGVGRATYFGTRLAQKMLGNTEEGRTAFDDLPLTTRPLYTGNPWFMSPIIQWHRMLDRLGV
jgi:glycine/D-amino acid oxidase-like deaminating enzyme